MEVLDFCYYISLLFLPITIYSLFFANEGLCYLIKLCIARRLVAKFQRKNKLSLDETTKTSLEHPSEQQNDAYTDTYFIYGSDQNRNSLSLRFTVRSGLIADVFLCLRLANGAIYTFPGAKTKTYRITSRGWKTKEVYVEILEPFKRLRVGFNGLLSSAFRDREHVRFSFIWVAAAAPSFYPQDAAVSPLAEAIARQRWTSGDRISLLGDRRGFEQFGALNGFVRCDAFSEDFYLNLPSCRTRLWGINEKLAGEKDLHLFVAGRDGTMISLWVKDDLQYGNVFTKNGTSWPIQQSDVCLDLLARPNTSSFMVHIDAKYVLYRTVFHMNVKNEVTDEDISLPRLRNIPADCDQNAQQAKALVEFCYRNNLVKVQPPPLLGPNQTREIPQSYVTSFTNEDSKIVQLTGGKGCSLALLTSLQCDDFSVPDGFIITVNAFNRQLEVNCNMRKAVSILDDVCCGRIEGDLQETCARTVKIFQDEEILPEIEKAIGEELGKIRRDPSDRWAVRSSAVGEDSEDLSAAGQNRTFLGCASPEEVIKSVSLCWASLFAYQSVQYRHNHGLPVATQMGVVVQRMVPADCAGVLFTCHPSTGNPALVVITANHGLGESVVSGRSEPDTVVLERAPDDDVAVKSKSLGMKNKIIKMVDGGVDEQEGLEGFSITDDQALALGRVGVFLEKKFGSARDIEWAFFQGRLFLLQSRPVTTLNTWSSWELLHEFDVANLTEDSVYTIANTGEILPGAISALTLSTVVKRIDDAIKKSMDDTYDIYAFKCLSTFQHHLFLDVINGVHKKVDKNIGLMSRILDLAIFGHPIIDKNIHFIALTHNGVAKGSDKLRDLVKMIKVAWRNEDVAKECRDIVARYDININSGDTLKDIYVKIGEGMEKFRDVIYCHSQTTRTSVSYQVFAMMVLAEEHRDFNVHHYNDIAMLFASCEDVISAEIPNALGKIAKILVESKQSEEFVGIQPEEGRRWLRINAPEASKAVEEFLKHYGHRGMREFDVYQPTWGSKPSQLIKMIQTNCRSKDPKREKVNATVDEVIAALVSPKKSQTRKILRFLIRKCRRAVGLREQTKSETIKFVDKLREAFGRLGRKMAFEGLIPVSNLIYHLTYYEIGQIIDGSGRNPALISKALNRQKLFPKWDLLKFPEISYAIPRNEIREFQPRTSGSQVKCEGTPVCAGVVQSRACVINDLAEIDQLLDGDILITYCTDVGWSPYFPMLGGIVTELGGLVSHGAVIAREYGLPCIVGAADATKLFKTGDIVSLSGKTGVIELIQD